MRILITGASGLVGLNLALEAAGRGLSGINEAGLSPLPGLTGKAEQDPGETAPDTVIGTVHHHRLQTDAFQVVQSDLLAPGELERLVDQTKPDWVINCAALAILDACEADPILAYKINAEFPEKLAAYVTRGGARLLHLSTDAVFDGRSGGYTEDDEPNPLNVYARSKLEGEKAVIAVNPQAIVARVNLIGWSLSGERSLAEWFFYNLQAGKQVKGFTDIFFCPLLVNDLAHILLKMLSLKLYGLYHAVSSQCLSKYEFGVALADRFGLDAGLISPASVEEAGLMASRSPKLTLRTDKLQRDLGHSLPDSAAAIDRLYRLYQRGYPQFLKSLGAGSSRP